MSETEVVIFKGPRIEQVRTIAPSIIGALEAKINGYFSIKRKDLIKFLEIAVEIGKKSQTYVEEIEEELGASGTIEYGFKLGDMTITEREARTRLQRFTTNEYLETHGYSGAEKIIEKLLEANPSDWDYPTEIYSTDLAERLEKTGPKGLAFLSQECFSAKPVIDLYTNIISRSRIKALEDPSQIELIKIQVQAEAYGQAAAILYLTGRPKIAKRRLDGALKLNLPEQYLYFAYAQHILSQDRVKPLDRLTALDYLDRAIVIDPDNVAFREMKEMYSSKTKIRIPEYIDSIETYERLVRRE